MKKITFFLLVFNFGIFGRTFAAADPLDQLPSERKVDWSLAGIPGGIPARGVCSVSISAGATLTTIQNALNNVACQNKAVFLPAGSYTLSGILKIPSNVTLRGAGAGKTILRVSSEYSRAAIQFGNFYPGDSGQIADSNWPSGNAKVHNIQSGYNKGSNSIVLDNVTGVVVGNLLTLDELDDASLPVSKVGQYGNYNYASRETGTRELGQTVEVKTISGNTVTFSPPLYWTYKSNLSPQALSFDLGGQYIGLEDLTVYDTATGLTDGVLMGGSMLKYSWIKGVEGDTAGGDHANFFESLGCVVRDSYFHDGQWHGSGKTDNNLMLSYKTSNCLIENNIFFRQHVGIMIKAGSSGNVIAYNYAGGMFHRDPSGVFVGAQVETMNGNHGAHPMYNLFEGNNLEGSLKVDNSWGSSSHGLIFRNWITGDGLRYAPIADGRPSSVDFNNPTHANQYMRGIILERAVNYYSVLGNILGNSYVKSSGNAEFQLNYPASRSYTKYYLIELGYADTTAGGGDAGPVQTTLINGNFDFLSSATKWDSSNWKNLPSSYYLSGKPSWWNNTYSWPAYGPDPNSSSTLLQGRIPAEICFKNNIVTGTGFSAAACYGDSTTPVSITHPADTNSDYLMGLNEATFFGACWKKAPDVSGGCPANATLDYAVRAGTLWNATVNGQYQYNSAATCPLCWEVKP